MPFYSNLSTKIAYPGAESLQGSRAPSEERLSTGGWQRTATVRDIERLKPSLSKVIVCFRNGETFRYQQGSRTLIPFEFSARFAFPGRQVYGSQRSGTRTQANPTFPHTPTPPSHRFPSAHLRCRCDYRYKQHEIGLIVEKRRQPFEAKIDRCHGKRINCRRSVASCLPLCAPKKMGSDPGGFR